VGGAGKWTKSLEAAALSLSACLMQASCANSCAFTYRFKIHYGLSVEPLDPLPPYKTRQICTNPTDSVGPDPLDPPRPGTARLNVSCCNYNSEKGSEPVMVGSPALSLLFFALSNVEKFMANQSLLDYFAIQ